MIDFADIMRERLRSGLINARKTRDNISIAVYRSLIAVLDNAGSASVDLSGPALQTRGSSDMPRTVLDHEDVVKLLKQEHKERITAAKEYRSFSREQEAIHMEEQAVVLKRIIEEWKAS